MRWLPEFDRPLGAPTAEAAFDELTGVASRSFASGKRTRLFALFIVLKCHLILPRQARDKHWESTTQKETRFLIGTSVTFNHTNNQGTIKWGDGAVTEGPGCAPDATKCRSCKPPSYVECI
jgi:hypothetical protein